MTYSKKLNVCVHLNCLLIQVSQNNVKTKLDASTAQVKVIYCKEQIPTAACCRAANISAKFQPVNKLFLTAIEQQKIIS